PTTTAIGPAFCAFLTLITNAHAPRSMSATFPLTCAALVNGSQPLVGTPVPSWTSTRFPVTPAVLKGAPNEAWPTLKSPASVDGLFTRSSGRGPSRTGDWSFTLAPSHTRLLQFMDEAERWASVMSGQCIPWVLSNRK